MARKAWTLIHATLDAYLQRAPDRDITANLARVVDPVQRKNLEKILTDPRLSYRDAVIIQLAYALQTPGLDTTERHPGARGVAEKLGAYFARNHIAGVANAYQNIGKNTTNLARGNFPEFDAFLHWAAEARLEQLDACFKYACMTVAATARPVLPMPDLDLSKLTFARVLQLYEMMLATPSEGAHEQFITASLLSAVVEQNRLAYRVETKKLTASDRSARTAGDIQIMTGNRVIEAYEVTGNHWTSKLSGIEQKIKDHDLSRIHIIAPVKDRDYTRIAQELLKVSEDVSVVDLHGFNASLLSTLTRTYRAFALHRLYEYLDRYQADVERVNAYVKLLKDSHLTTDPAE